MNTSGFEPLDLRVLVLPDPVTEKIGNIFIPDAHKEREQFAQQKATLVAAGENAWEEACARSPKFRRPQPGDRILISKYAGVMVTGDDGKEYRVMNDEDVVCRLFGGDTGGLNG